MKLDVVAPGEAQAPVADRADIFAITPNLIAQLADFRKVAYESRRAERALLSTRPKDYIYRIGPRDILRIIVWDHPELNLSSGSSLPQTQSQTGSAQSSGATEPVAEPVGREVESDGTIFFPYVGTVKVAGKTTQELRAFLSGALTKTIRSPQVDVSIEVYRSSKIYMSGEVKVPGIVPISDGPLTLLDAISIAGGPTDNADLSNATLRRGDRSYDVDLYSLFYNGRDSENFVLQSGDVLHVPEKRANKVFILGEVGVGPGPALSLPVPRGTYSLAEALSDAGGINQITANAAHVYVIRGTVESRPQIFHLNAQSPDALILADGFKLEPRDVVYVDASSVTRFNRVLSQILPTASLLQTGASISATSTGH